MNRDTKDEIEVEFCQPNHGKLPCHKCAVRVKPEGCKCRGSAVRCPIKEHREIYAQLQGQTK